MVNRDSATAIALLKHRLGTVLCRLGYHDMERVAEFSCGSWRDECQRKGCTHFDYEKRWGHSTGKSNTGQPTLTASSGDMVERSSSNGER
jgi:hypothetical protein